MVLMTEQPKMTALERFKTRESPQGYLARVSTKPGEVYKALAKKLNDLDFVVSTIPTADPEKTFVLAYANLLDVADYQIIDNVATQAYREANQGRDPPKGQWPKKAGVKVSVDMFAVDGNPYPKSPQGNSDMIEQANALKAEGAEDLIFFGRIEVRKSPAKKAKSAAPPEPKKKEPEPEVPMVASDDESDAIDVSDMLTNDRVEPEQQTSKPDETKWNTYYDLKEWFLVSKTGNYIKGV